MTSIVIETPRIAPGTRRPPELKAYRIIGVTEDGEPIWQTTTVQRTRDSKAGWLEERIDQ